MLDRFTIARAALAALTLLGVAGCGGDGGQQAPAPVARAELETVAATAGAGGGERLFDGLVEAVEQATLAAQTSGRIVALLRDVDDPVRRGETILRISAVEQRAQVDAAGQALAEAEAQAIEARAAFERTRKLFGERLLSESDLERATATRDSAEARLAAARAGLAAAREQLGYTEVRAPFDGVVTARHVEVGEAVSPGQPLTAVAAPEALRVVVDVPQGLAEAIRRLGRARVYAGEQTIDAARLTVFPAAASGSNTVRVRVDLPPRVADLYPGMFAKAGFAVGEAANLLVPARAVLRRSEVTAVYVVADDGRVALRQVRLGRTLGESVEVLAGLTEGERVALDPVAATPAVARQHAASS